MTDIYLNDQTHNNHNKINTLSDTEINESGDPIDLMVIPDVPSVIQQHDMEQKSIDQKAFPVDQGFDHDNNTNTLPTYNDTIIDQTDNNVSLKIQNNFRVDEKSVFNNDQIKDDNDNDDNNVSVITQNNLRVDEKSVLNNDQTKNDNDNDDNDDTHDITKIYGNKDEQLTSSTLQLSLRFFQFLEFAKYCVYVLFSNVGFEFAISRVLLMFVFLPFLIMLCFYTSVYITFCLLKCIEFALSVTFFDLYVSSCFASITLYGIDKMFSN